MCMSRIVGERKYFLYMSGKESERNYSLYMSRILYLSRIFSEKIYSLYLCITVGKSN